MAHEASHHILSKMYAMPSEGRFHAEYDSERSYSKEELAQMFASVEWQADIMGASLLMPRRIIENAFLENLTHALENIWLSQSRYVIHKEVAISQVFQDSTYDDLFYMGRFDFVVYEKQGKRNSPFWQSNWMAKSILKMRWYRSVTGRKM